MTRLSRFVYLHLPVIIFSLTWSLLYFIYALDIFKVDRLHGSTWLILFASNMTVLLGYFIFHSYSDPHTEYHNLQIHHIRVKHWKIAVLVLVLFIISFSAVVIDTYLYLVKDQGFLGFFSNPIKARYEAIAEAKEAKEGLKIYQSLLAFLRNLNYVAIVLSGVLFASTRKYRFICVLPLIAAFAASISQFERHFIMSNVFIWFCSIFYTSAHLPLGERARVYRALKRIAVLVGTLVICYFAFIIMYRTELLRNASSTRENIALIVARSIHSYFVGNIVMLDWYLLDHIKLRYGTSLFVNLFRWFNVMGIYENPEITSYILIYKFMRSQYLQLNTFTYIRAFYEDFGAIGVMVFSFFWGAAAYIVVRSYLKKFSLFILFLLCSLCYSFFLSFFDFYFRTMLVPLYCSLFLILLDKFAGFYNYDQDPGTI